MKNKKTRMAVAAGLAIFFLIFAWLFWGSTVPEPTDPAKKAETNTPKAAVYNTTLNRDADGKRLWELKVGEAVQVNDDLIRAKDLEGTVYLSNGDEVHLKASGAEVKVISNEFALTQGVTARWKNGGFIKADKIEWDQQKDLLTAAGAVRIVRGDLLATAENVITSSKLEHFKLRDKAHLERGGHYEEK